MLTGLHHVGIACADIDAAVEAYTRSLRATLVRRGTENGLHFAFLESSGLELELIEAVDPASEIGRFARRTGTGLHHLAYAVTDIRAEAARLVAEGFAQRGEIRTGIHRVPIVFFEPRPADGVLTELIEIRT